MFQYMRDAGIVEHGRPKRYGKEVVRVFVKKMQQPGAAFLMIKNIRATSQLRDFLYALDNKPFNVLCQFQILFYHVLVLSIKEVTV